MNNNEIQSRNDTVSDGVIHKIDDIPCDDVRQCDTQNCADLIDSGAAQAVVSDAIDDAARQSISDADAVRMAAARAQVVAGAAGASTLAAAAHEMARQRKKSMERKGKRVRKNKTARPIVGPLAEALSAPPVAPSESIDLAPYLPSPEDRPEWYEPDPLLGGRCAADVLRLAADRETAGAGAMCEELGITTRQWSAWLLCAPRETADLVRRLQRIAAADEGVERLRSLLGDSDPYVQLGAVKMAVVDLDPERHAGSLHKDQGDADGGRGGPTVINIMMGPDMRGV